MKFHSIFVLLLLLSLLLAPLAAVTVADGMPQAEKKPQGGTAQSAGEAADSADKPAQGESVRVFRSSDGRVDKVSTEEYLIGTLAAEMSPAMHPQALQAQAVACYTYVCYVRQNEGKDEEPMQGADISDDSGRHQGYLSEKQRREKWGERFDSYEKKLRENVRAVQGILLCYDGAPILAVFHAISPGQTETAAAVWGEDYPYLQSVPSPGDKLSPDCAAALVLTREQFEKKIKTLDGVKPRGEPQDWLGKSESNPGGTVKTLEICGTRVSGTQIRELFDLKSAAFTLRVQDGSFRFQTKGWGHAVGMSQYGADYMARQGSDWTEILAHYYPGAQIEQAK